MVEATGGKTVNGSNWHMEIRDFFDGMPDVRGQYLAMATRKVYPKNEIIFFEDDESPSCFYLEKGIVKIFKITLSGKEPIFFMRHEGEMFGLAEVAESKRRKCNAQTLTECVLHILPRERDRQPLPS